jgi:hypothetical protein
VAESSHYAWEEEPNELPAQANALAAGGGRQGFAGVGDPTGITVYYFDGDHDGIEDLFAVTLTQSAPLELTLTSTGGADLDLFLFSASGSQLTLLGSSNGSTGNERIATNGPTAARPPTRSPPPGRSPGRRPRLKSSRPTRRRMTTFPSASPAKPVRRAVFRSTRKSRLSAAKSASR